MAQAHSDGFAQTPGHIHVESRGIAVPIFGADRSVVAGIGVVVANDGSSPQPAVELLTVAATAISRELAHSHEQARELTAMGVAEPMPGISQRSWEYIAELQRQAARVR